MKLIFSDIHSNIEAMQAVLNQCIHLDLEMICLGDIIGYGANPLECLALIKKHNIRAVRGNHEEAVLTNCDLAHFNEYAMDAMVWTRNAITKSDKLMIAELPYFIIENEIMYVHGTPYAPKAFKYITDFYLEEQSFRKMIRLGVKTCFIGHTHKPLILEYSKETGNIVKIPDFSFGLKENCLYIINVGSCGQSRCGVPEAFYVLFDEDKNSIQIKSTPYDIEASANAIKKAKLPEKLATRLLEGI